MTWTKEKQAEYMREYRKTHPQKARPEYMRAYRDSHPKVRVDQRYRELFVAYGITREEYEQLFIKQEGRCASCGKMQTHLCKALAVDHDHKTGKVRGLLCEACNLMLGKAGDNPDTLRAGADYLENFDVFASIRV